MKKYLCIGLALIFSLLPFFASCNPAEKPEGSSSASSTNSESAPAPTGTPTSEPTSTSTPAPTPTPTQEPTPTPTPTPASAALKLCGEDISKYKIIYPVANASGEKEQAEAIAAFVLAKYNVTLPVEADSAATTPCEILLGKDNAHVTNDVKEKSEAIKGFCNTPSHATIVSAGTTVWLVFSNRICATMAGTALMIDMEPQAATTIHLDYSSANSIKVMSIKKNPDAEVLRVMSYNVQTGTPDPIRAEQMLNNILDFDADIVGTQEVNAKWLAIFREKGILDTYTYVGEPRYGNKLDASNGNEYSGILFKTDKFNLIDTKTWWLTDTPEKPSKIEQSDYIRVMTYAVLERKTDGKRFVHVNTHLDYNPKGNPEQTKILLQLTQRIMDQHGKLPVFFTGDFNETAKSQGYASMLQAGNSDSSKIATYTTEKDTFSGGSIIDFCFVSNNDFVVDTYDVGFGKKGSDHYPVYVEMYLNS